MAHSGSTTGSNKRARTSESDVGFGLDLNDDFDATEGEGPPNVQLRRPSGRDKARKGASSSGKALATSDSKLATSIDKALVFSRKKYESSEAANC